jgi:hypothetical protein
MAESPTCLDSVFAQIIVDEQDAHLKGLEEQEPRQRYASCQYQSRFICSLRLPKNIVLSKVRLSDIFSQIKMIAMDFLHKLATTVKGLLIESS